MFKILFSFILITGLVAPVNSSDIAKINICANSDEIMLYNLINDYRKSNGLSKIPLSASLTKVAQAHARDLYENYQMNDKCNPHSWSDKGEWKGCCYTNDHKNPECMWDKPKEMTDYQGDGFEIVYFHSLAVEPESAMQSWKKSKGHNPVIINRKQWSKVEWKAVGIGIYKNYATVWFGMVPDTHGSPEKCK